MSKTKNYNDLLDGEQYHSDDLRITGNPNPIPLTMNSSGRTSGGSESTALNAINYVTVDYEAAAARNIRDIRENIARRRAREEALLTSVVQ